VLGTLLRKRASPCRAGALRIRIVAERHTLKLGGPFLRLVKRGEQHPYEPIGARSGRHDQAVTCRADCNPAAPGGSNRAVAPCRGAFRPVGRVRFRGERAFDEAF